MQEREVADALNECRILASVRNPRIVNFEVGRGGVCGFGFGEGRQLPRTAAAGRLWRGEGKGQPVGDHEGWLALVCGAVKGMGRL